MFVTLLLVSQAKKMHVNYFGGNLGCFGHFWELSQAMDFSIQ